jgi:tight adherence protein B
MNLDPGLQLFLIILLAIIAISAVVIGFVFPGFASGSLADRLKGIASARASDPASGRAPGKLIEGSKDSRRRQVQEAIRQVEEKEARSSKRLTLRALIIQSGLELSMGKFWTISAALGGLSALLCLQLGLPWYMALLCGFVALLGIPRWFLGVVRNRRMEKFLTDLPDAIDIMVRGLRSGLPMSDAMKIIASETGPPIGPEFLEVVEGQRVGIKIEQGLERMYERVPLQEVNFLAIVMNIQSKTGGNLTETLGNLSKVLRDRRKMKARIISASQEAKSSAAIIGCLPFLIMAALSFLNPDYLTPLFTTTAGNLMLIGCAVWMMTGILVMWKMINFDV